MDVNVSKKTSTYAKYLPIIILVLIFLAGWQYLILYKDIDDAQNRIIEVDTKYQNMEWAMIVSVLENAKAGSNVRTRQIATEIINDVNIEYPNLDVLKTELDKNPDKLDTAYGTILLEVPKDKYYNNIFNNRNNVIIVDDKGVIVSYRAGALHQNVRATWDEDLKDHYNPSLGRCAINKILAQDTELIFWEIDPPIVENHMIITDCRLDELRAVYYKEGLEGLYGYTFLVPAYITGDGDIFGTLDYDPSTGDKNNNHKLIVLQKFNLYDIITKYYSMELTALDIEHQESVDKYENDIRIRCWLTVITIFFELVVIVLAMSFNKSIRDDIGK